MQDVLRPSARYLGNSTRIPVHSPCQNKKVTSNPRIKEPVEFVPPPLVGRSCKHMAKHVVIRNSNFMARGFRI